MTVTLEARLAKLFVQFGPFSVYAARPPLDPRNRGLGVSGGSNLRVVGVMLYLKWYGRFASH